MHIILLLYGKYLIAVPMVMNWCSW